MSKETERNQLHSTIWSIADDLRGSVDGWDFKQYILGMLFYRFISENLTEYINEQEKKAGNKDFDYTKLSDKEALKGMFATVDEKGFYILPSQLFCNVLQNAKENQNLNVDLDAAFKAIEKSAQGHRSEPSFKGLFDDLDLNSRKLGDTVIKRNEKLLKIMQKINSLKVEDYKMNTIDLFGDAYEYLMGMYAANAGRSGGEYFTPQEVSELLAKIASYGQENINKVYDPCCGSGSLLLKFAKITNNPNLKYYGQEINNTTYNLCRINMFLHNINYSNFDIQCGDTLLEPKQQDNAPFDAIVSNPPYSISWEGEKNPILIKESRFAGPSVLAPSSKADLAFTIIMLNSLSEKGTAAIVEFPGVMYRGGKEQKIRQYLVDNGYVDAVIQLPIDLFFGTSIGTCILVLKKNKKDNTILFIDASNEFVRSDAKNKLSEQNIENILKTYIDRKDVDSFCKLVKTNDIKNNKYDLSVNKYLIKPQNNNKINIGLINDKLKVVIEKSNKIRKELSKLIKRISYDKE